MPQTIALDQDPIHALCTIAPLLIEDRRSLAAALRRLRSITSSIAAPQYFRHALRRNTISLRRAISVRNRALWLTRAGRFAEALLVIDTAKSVLCCESAPCHVQQIDAWLPVHRRAIELLDSTHSRIFHDWRAA